MQLVRQPSLFFLTSKSSSSVEDGGGWGARVERRWGRGECFRDEGE